MGLFTDGISSIEDLMGQDSSVLSTAQTENINLTQKMTLAQQDLGIQLTALLQRSNTYDWEFWLEPNPQLNNIVITPPLQLWHAYHSLEMVYQDAYFNQLNDRYKAKRDQFQLLAKQAMDMLIQTGVGIVSDPIPQAAPPQLTSIPGGQPAMTCYASVSWLNVEGEQGESGNPSCLTVAAGNALAVQPVSQPANAVAWNVFVGATDSTLILQNTTPVAPDQIWVQAGPVLTTGTGTWSGQAPNYLRALPRVLQRG